MSKLKNKDIPGPIQRVIIGLGATDSIKTLWKQYIQTISNVHFKMVLLLTKEIHEPIEYYNF